MNIGLTTKDAEDYLQKYGLNDVIENRKGMLKKFLKPLYSPISLMLLAAAFLSFLNREIFNAYFIFALYFVNYSIQRWQEFKADKAIKELQNKLSFDVLVLRDSVWIKVSAKKLVPKDRIKLGLGSIIPADAKIIASNNLLINEAVITGESTLKEKKIDDVIYSGSFISSGNLEAEITATGKNTSFGKTIFSIEQSTEKSLLEKDILYITRFLTAISVVAVFILTTAFLLRGAMFESILTLDLSLIIAGIPIALPAVMAIILSIGAGGLAKKSVIVRRLSALQDLANVNLLLTDKTGTLTKNEISITNVVSYDRNFNQKSIIEFAGYAISQDTPDQIDDAIVKKLKQEGIGINDAHVISFIPYNADRKRTTAIVQKDSESFLISVGAPQIIKSFDKSFAYESDTRVNFEKDIERAGAEGYRVLAVAIKKDGVTEEDMNVIGLLFLSDPLDETSKETIQFMKQNGIAVKVLTGDNKTITERIIKELDLSGEVCSAEETKNIYLEHGVLKNEFNNVVAFSEISPKEKYEIVKLFKSQYTVALTGDGINDLPALKIAHVGIAVSGAVSALKSLADIVLLGQGISVIKDAILESRKIFVRLYNYSVYRISESFRLVITILILGLWYGYYPLVPLQLILLAFLNDIPIISLAVDRVKISAKPSEIKTKERFRLSLLFGTVGVFNSIILFFIMNNLLHLSLPVIQTIFFLKLTVSGHSLIFVAHTKEKWFKFLPSKEVIFATIVTQLIATTLAVTGFLMPSKISIFVAILVWVWALFWMQVSELMKDLQIKFAIS